MDGKKPLICIITIAISCLFLPKSIQAQSDSIYFSLQQLATRAFIQNKEAQNKALEKRKVEIDVTKAKMAYLPKIQLEAAYTFMNDELAFPPDLIQLLNGTQSLLIKEQLAQSTGGAIGFGTSPETVILPDGTTLGQVIESKSTPIPPIQERGFFKTNVSAQMLIFSGLKVSRSIKAAKHQLKAYDYLLEAENSTILIEVIGTYHKMAIIRETKKTLAQSEIALKEQQKFVEKAFQNGLTTSISKHKIALAMEQLEVKKIELNMAETLVALQLSTQTGIPTDSVSRLAITLQPWIISTSEANAENRMEIKALDEAIQATHMKKKAEMSAYIPKLVGFGKYEFYKDNLTLLDPEWYVGVGLQWTIFDGLAARNQARQIEIDKTILQNKRNNTLEQAQIKLEKERLEQNKQLQLLSIASRQKKLAGEVLNLSSRQFEQGLITLNDHLEAIQEYEKSCLNQIQVIAAQRNSALEYLMSTGQLQLENLPRL